MKPGRDPASVRAAPPVDNSGLLGEAPQALPENKVKAEAEPRVTLPLFSHVRSKLRGTTLELKFRLAVKARVKLIAKRKRRVVASTPTRTLRAGNRALEIAAFLLLSLSARMATRVTSYTFDYAVPGCCVAWGPPFRPGLPYRCSS